MKYLESWYNNRHKKLCLSNFQYVMFFNFQNLFFMSLDVNILQYVILLFHNCIVRHDKYTGTEITNMHFIIFIDHFKLKSNYN